MEAHTAVRFAPLNIPMERRLQTAAVLIWGAQLLVPIIVLVLALLQPWFWPLLVRGGGPVYTHLTAPSPQIAYLIWMLSDDAPVTGGRPIKWMRKNSFTRHFANYFPASLRKEHDIDPKQKYIFGCT